MDQRLMRSEFLILCDTTFVRRNLGHVTRNMSHLLKCCALCSEKLSGPMAYLSVLKNMQ